MGVRSLAEAIILQSIEDLWNKKESQDCIAYFKGDAFDICARLAGMKIPDQVRLLTLLKGVVRYEKNFIRSLRKENYIEYSISRGR